MSDTIAAPPPAMGDNKPPSAIEMAREAYRALAAFLAATPVIQDQETAKRAKIELDRVKATAGDLAEARKAETDPPYKAWQEAISKYKPATENLGKLIAQLEERIKKFLDAEEDKRLAEAARLRQAAEEAARKAEEAARIEADVRENAELGEIGADVGGAVEALTQAASDAARLERQAAVAERDAENVRLSGGFQRAVSVRKTMKPVIKDHMEAIKAVGLTDDIAAAILKASRAYKKLNGRWPAGIDEVEERSI